jgi:hypothetical protein
MLLIKEKQQLASEGKYLEAEAIRRKINELRENNINLKKKEINQHHVSELRSLEEAYNKEITEHIKQWGEIFSQFQEKIKKQEDILADKHRYEMHTYITDLEAKLNMAIKYSKEYIDLKDSELNLVKLERFLHKLNL